MIYRCPGQDNRVITVKPVTCPKCAYVAEIFSDETKVRCPKCGARIDAELLPTCVDWCKHAQECVGEERWKKLKKVE